MVVNVPNNGVALFIQIRKREIYPFDLSGLFVCTNGIKKWRAMNLGHVILLPNGVVVEICEAALVTKTFFDKVKSYVPFQTLKLELEFGDPQLSFGELKAIVLDGAKDQFESFGNDPGEHWKVLTTAPLKLAAEIELCRDASDLYKVLELPDKSNVLPNL